MADLFDEFGVDATAGDLFDEFGADVAETEPTPVPETPRQGLRIAYERLSEAAPRSVRLPESQPSTGDVPDWLRSDLLPAPTEGDDVYRPRLTVKGAPSAADIPDTLRKDYVAPPDALAPGQSRDASRLETAVGQFVRGAAGVVTSIPKQAAIQAVASAREAIEPEIGVSRIEARARRGDPLAKAELEGLKPAIDPREHTFYKAAEDIDAAVQGVMVVNPEYAEEFLAGQVPSGLGSALGFMAATIATGPVGGAALGASANAQEQFEDALSKGASLADATDAARMAGAFGLSEVVPIAHLLERIDKGAGGTIRRAVMNALKQGTEEAIQESAQSVFKNIVASDLVKYDPERQMFVGVGDATGTGFTVGAIMGGIGTLLAGRRSRTGASAKQAAPSGEMTADDLAAELDVPVTVAEVEAAAMEPEVSPEAVQPVESVEAPTLAATDTDTITEAAPEAVTAVMPSETTTEAVAHESAPLFPITETDKGGITVLGDPDAIRQTLKSAGVPAVGIKSARGVMFGKSRAEAVRAALAPMGAAQPVTAQAQAIQDAAPAQASPTVKESLTVQFRPTHELPDGTPVIATEEPNVWADADGNEYEDNYAQPIQAAEGRAHEGQQAGRISPEPAPRQPVAETARPVPPVGQADAGRADVAKTAQAGEPDAQRQPVGLPITTNPRGSITVKGEPEAIRSALQSAGVPHKGLKAKNGVTFSKNHADAVRKALDVTETNFGDMGKVVDNKTDPVGYIRANKQAILADLIAESRKEIAAAANRKTAKAPDVVKARQRVAAKHGLEATGWDAADMVLGKALLPVLASRMSATMGGAANANALNEIGPALDVALAEERSQDKETPASLASEQAKETKPAEADVSDDAKRAEPAPDKAAEANKKTDKKADENKVAAILNAANVTGKDRLDIMRDFRDGKYSLKDLEDAYSADQGAGAGKEIDVTDTTVGDMAQEVEPASETLGPAAEPQGLQDETQGLPMGQVEFAMRPGVAVGMRGFPGAIIGAPVGAARNHPDYQAAKAGDTAAAYRLVRDTLQDATVEKIRAELNGRRPRVVPVVAVEAAGTNKIPSALARAIADRLGLEVETGVVQAEKVGRGGEDGFYRLANRPTFDGAAAPGDYLLVDDTITQGGTFAALKTHIEQAEGIPVLAVALTGKQYSATLAPSDATLSALRDKHGNELENWWNEQFGHGFDSLTESEARYLLGISDAQQVRDRVSAARSQRGGRGDQAPDRSGQEPLDPSLSRTDQSRALTAEDIYRAPAPVAYGMESERVEQIAARVALAWGSNAPEIRVYPSARRAPEWIANQVTAEDEANIQGVHDPITGDVYLFSDYLRSARDVHRILGHEAAGHTAMDEVVDSGDVIKGGWPSVERRIDFMVKAGNKQARSLRDEVARRGYDMNNRSTVTKEMLAIAVERHITDGPIGRLLRQLRAAMRDLLRKAGINSLMPGADIDAMVVRSLRFLTESGGRRRAIPEALEHPQLGDIDVAMGKGRMGASKFVAEHPEIGANLEDRIAGATLVEETATRATLENEGVTFGLIKKAGRWVLTDARADFARSDDTQGAYESRIDELFAGEKPSPHGVRVLDRSDVLNLLGYGDLPIHVAEGKVSAGQYNHGLTAEHWKKIPEWLENPVAVFDSDTVAGRLVFVAPDAVRGAPVVMIVEPETTMGRVNVHLLVNAYEKTGRLPVQRWVEDGLLRYLDEKQSPVVSTTTGLRLPRVVHQQRGSKKRILTQRDLVKRRAEPTVSGMDFARDALTPMTQREGSGDNLTDSKPLQPESEGAIVSGEGEDLVTLYHGTSKEGADSIRESGRIEAGRYFGGIDGVSLTPRREIAEEYADDGEVIVVKVPRSKLVVDPESYDSRDVEKALSDGASVYATGPILIRSPNQSQRTQGAGVDFARAATAAQQGASTQAALDEIPTETAFQRQQRLHQDKFNRFRVIEEWLQERGASLTEASSVYKAEERYHGRVATRTEDFREQTLKPLIQKIQKSGYTLGQVSEFLHAQHAEERNEQIAKINPAMPDGGSGMTNAEADAILTKAPKELADLANEYRAITDRTREMLLKAGIITQEMADAWQATYEHYVPLKGGDEAVAGGTGKGFTAKNKQKRAMGHRARDEMILENIQRDHERAIMLVEKNRVGQHLLRLAVDAGVPDLITIDKPKKRAVLRDIKTYDVTYHGSTVGSFDTLEAARVFVSAESGKPGRNAADFAINTSHDPTVAYMASPMLQPNETQVYVDGHAVRVQFNDELLAQAYNNLGTEHMNAIFRAGRQLNAYLSRMYTGYSIDFIFTNAMRDWTSGLLNITGAEGIRFAAKAAKNYPKAAALLAKYAATGKPSPLVKQYRADGGTTGAAYLSDLERLGHEAKAAYDQYAGLVENVRAGKPVRGLALAGEKAITSVLKPIERLNMVFENAMRLSAYMTALESGMSREHAASLAKNATVNFNRKGEIGQQMNALWLFHNASMQGTAIILKSLFRSKHKRQVQALVGGLVSIGALMAATMGGADDDDYEKLPEHVKERNLTFRTKDGWVTIPIPYGYGWFVTLGRKMHEAATGKISPGEAALRVAANLAEETTVFGTALSADEPEAKDFLFLLPTAVQIPAVPAMNRTAFHSPLYPESFNPEKPDSQLMYRNTIGSIWDKTANWMNEATGGDAARRGWVDVSPETLKYIWNTATGGTGRGVTDTINAVKLVSEDADPELRELPIVRRFAQETQISGARARFWKYAKEAKAAKNRYDLARKAKSAALVDDVVKQERHLLQLADMADDFSKAISAKRDEIDRIRNDETISLAKRRLQIKALEKEEEKLYDQYVERHKRVAEEAKADQRS